MGRLGLRSDPNCPLLLSSLLRDVTRCGDVFTNRLDLTDGYRLLGDVLAALLRTLHYCDLFLPQSGRWLSSVVVR